MTFKEYVKDRFSKELDVFVYQLFENKLVEGGAFGHMQHPYEDIDLSFGDIKNIINYVFSGKAEAYEKIDGQQISFSWKNNRLIFARNKSHIKNYGENALTPETMPQFFGADVPKNIIDTFYKAALDLQSSLRTVPPQKLIELFQEGKRFMNAEIVSKDTQNVVPYYKDFLVFHGLIEYDKDGNPIKSIPNSGQQLDQILKSTGASNPANFSLRGPNKVVLKNFSDLPIERENIMRELQTLQGKLPDSSTIANYQELKWFQLLNEKSKEYKYNLPKDVSDMLLGRWVQGQKATYNIKNILSKIDNQYFKQWVAEFDKSAEKQNKVFTYPLELFFLHLGAEVLYNASGFLSASPNESIAHFAQKIKSESEKIINSKNIEDIKKLKYELERIERIGGLSKLKGTEGIVFSMNGKLYKLTGLFAGINQINGILKFKRK